MSVKAERNAEDDLKTMLERVYERSAANDTRKAIRAVIDFFDDRMSEGNFETCDEALTVVDLDRVTASAVVSFIGMTKCAKDKLPARATFLHRVRERLLKEPDITPAELDDMLRHY